MTNYLFFSKYLNYIDMISDINTLCDNFPKNIDVEKIDIAKTLEGRSIIAIRVYPEGKQIEKPTIWIDANMHSVELIGTNTVLAQIHFLITKLNNKESKYFSVNYIFVPRICPDGAEQYFTEGKRNRSNARDSRTISELGTYWKRECLLDKNVRNVGLNLFLNKKRVGFMRKKNESGIWVADEVYPQLIRHRELGDSGPFYDIYPEGAIENFDGINIPPATHVNDNEIDLNRNFPVSWVPNHLENMSGKISLSEIESRAIAEFAISIPQIYFWLNYHSFGGVFIRPLESQDDSNMNIFDRSVYQTIDKKIEEITGYPSVNGHSEFTYIPGKPLQGCLTSFAYHSLGAYSYVCELWDFPLRIDRTERPFINRYNNWQKKEWRKIYEFDCNHNHGIMFGHPWKSFNHPQIGDVEISELPVYFGINNPPQELIHDVINTQLGILPLLIDIAPMPKVTTRLSSIQDRAIKYIELTISNIGFLPTFVSEARNNSQGSKKIIIEIIEVKNAKLIGNNVYQIEPLTGYCPIIKGWINSADSGTNTSSSKTIRIPVSVENEKIKIRAVFKINFSHLGSFYTTFEN